MGYKRKRAGTTELRNGSVALSNPACLNDAEQPQDKNQDQDAAKTDIHDTLLCLVLLSETVSVAGAFQSLRKRHEPCGYDFTRQQSGGFA